MHAGRPIIALFEIGIAMRRYCVLALFSFVTIGATAPAFADDKAVCFALGSEDYKDKEKLKAGEEACTRLINASTARDRTLAAIYRARGSWYQKKGALDHALGDYASAIKFEPKNAENFDYRGDVYRQKGDLDRALSDYDRASKLDPGYVSAYYSRGRVFEMKKEIDRARAEFNATIKLPAKDRIAQWAQDNARMRLKAMDEAEKEEKKK
jgi:tetratricopeptide (TPR) repeat protein